MKFKNFIWDFDGTLIDTYYHSTTAFFDIMRPLGVNDDFDKVMRILRHSLRSVQPVYNMSDELFMKFLDHACELWFEPVPTVYEGIEGVLKEVVNRGGQNFLYTNRDHTAIDYLAAFKLIDYFTECVINGDEAYVSKPGGGSVEYIIKKYSLDKSETVMVGDREIDVLSGKSGGANAILFDQQFLNPETKADIVVNYIKDVGDYIK